MPTIIARTATLPRIATLALICDEPGSTCPYRDGLHHPPPRRCCINSLRGGLAFRILRTETALPWAQMWTIPFANYGNEAAPDPRSRLENYRDLSRLGQKPEPENRSLGVVHGRNLPEGIDG